MTEDVISEDAVNQPQGEVITPQPSATGEPKTPEATVVAPDGDTTKEPDVTQSQTENLNKALKEERERRKSLQRELAAAKGAKSLEAYKPEDLESVMTHPFVQDLIEKQTTTELKDGTKQILAEYPMIPKHIAKAIEANPRGFVKEGTADVDNALLDIADYINSIVEEPQAMAPQPKVVPVIGNNNVSDKGSKMDLEISEIQKIPPEEWTPEQEKAVSDYIKNNKK